MRNIALSLLVAGYVVPGLAVCQESKLHVPSSPAPEQAARTLKTVLVSSPQSRQAYFELLCEYLTTKEAAPSAFDLTTVAVINQWHSDASYRSAHAVLADLNPARAVGLEHSAADNKGLTALWVIETRDKQVWLVSSRNGILVSASRKGFDTLPHLIAKAESISQRSEVKVSEVLDGTVHSIVVLNGGVERVSIFHDLPDGITSTWEEIHAALLREDSMVRKAAAGTNLGGQK